MLIVNRMKVLAIFIFFFIFALGLPAYAQEADATVSSQVIAAPAPSSDYILPYPGILPTSPFYKLKTMRDQLVGFLISDMLKRTEFDLLQADKRLNAGFFMFNSNRKKDQLIIDVVSKGENYFSQAIAVADQAKKQGENTREITIKMLSAAYKHKEVITLMQHQGSSSLRKGLQHEQERVASFIATLKGMTK